MVGEAPTPEAPIVMVERRRTLSEWRKLTMFVVCLLVFTGGGFYYANWKAERNAREADQR